METVEDKGELQLVWGGRPMIRNRGHDGAAEEGGYSSGGGEVSLGVRKEDGRSRGNRQTE